MRTMRYGAAFALTLAAAAFAAPLDGQGRGRGSSSADPAASGRGAAKSEAQPQGRGRSDERPAAQGRGRGAERPAAQGRGSVQNRGQAASPAQGRGVQGRGQASGATQGRGAARSQDVAPRGRGAAAQGRGNVVSPGAATEAGRGLGRGRGGDPTSRSDAGRVDPSFTAGGVGRARFTRPLTMDDLRPSVRPFAMSSRAPERLAAVAVALAHARGMDDDAIVITSSGDRVRFLNRNHDVLLDLNDARARNVGWWDLVVLPERTTGNAPAFCRSGEGHPVWGRQWCLDKGFGLGTLRDIRWGRAIDPRDIVLRRESPVERLTREVLQQVLGETAFSRMALHALTLGLSDPLTGRWLGEPASSTRVLLVESGTQPVYEVVDLDGDGRADMLIGAVRPW